VKSYGSAAPAAQSSIAGRFIFLLAGFLLSATSICIAGMNGFARGATVPEAVLWAGAGVALALCSLGGISTRRALAVCVYALGLAFTAIAALGSQHGGRALNEATAAALTGERGRLEAQYKRADAAIAKLPATRPTAVVQAELDAVLRDPRLNGCYGWLENSRLRAVCVERVEPLRTELANATERKRLTGELATTSEALGSLTVAKPANADADSLGRYLEALGVNISRDRLTDLLNLLTVASVELAGGIALALGHRLPSNSPNVAPNLSPKNELSAEPKHSPKNEPNVRSSWDTSDTHNWYTNLLTTNQPKSQERAFRTLN
jgi:hypothetical protein